MTDAQTTPPSDVLGYRQTRWGMTASELREAIGDELEESASRRDFKKYYADYHLSDIEIDGDSYQVIFQFDKETDRLAQVLLRRDCDTFAPPVLAYQSVEALLTRKYGAPTLRSGEPLDQVTQWIFPTTSIELMLTFVEGVTSMISIRYESATSSNTDNL